jgi:hypothetical protein
LRGLVVPSILMATQIKVQLDRSRQDRIDDGALRKVWFEGWLAAFGDGGLGGKNEFVPIANDEEHGGRVEV